MSTDGESKDRLDSRALATQLQHDVERAMCTNVLSQEDVCIMAPYAQKNQYILLKVKGLSCLLKVGTSGADFMATLNYRVKS